MDNTFLNLVKDNVIYSLERDRRSGYPIFDIAKVIKIGDTRPIPNRETRGYSQLVNLTISDSAGNLTIDLPADNNEGICNGIYYTLDINKILTEVGVLKDNALNIINNIDKYESTVKECENIQKFIQEKFVPIQDNKPTDDLEDFKKSVEVKMDTQNKMIASIYEALGLGKDKEPE